MAEAGPGLGSAAEGTCIGGRPRRPLNTSAGLFFFLGGRESNPGRRSPAAASPGNPPPSGSFEREVGSPPIARKGRNRRRMPVLTRCGQELLGACPARTAQETEGEGGAGGSRRVLGEGGGPNRHLDPRKVQRRRCCPRSGQGTSSRGTTWELAGNSGYRTPTPTLLTGKHWRWGPAARP